MGHLFEVEFWARHPRGYSLGCVRLRKLAKEMTKALERKNGIFRTFIYENNGN